METNFLEEMKTYFGTHTAAEIQADWVKHDIEENKVGPTVDDFLRYHIPSLEIVSSNPPSENQ
jgi:hypothetical protein